MSTSTRVAPLAGEGPASGRVSCLVRAACTWISRSTMAASSVLLLLIMLLGAIDVAAQFVRASLPFKLELSEVMFAAAVFLALPMVQFEGADIAIDLLPARRTGPTRRVLDRLACVLASAFLVAVAFFLWRLAGESYALGEQAVGYWPFPVYPFKFLCAIGASGAALVALARCTGIIDMQREEA